MTTHRLLFLNPVLKDPGQLQTTVRKGEKWLGLDADQISVRRTGFEEIELATGWIFQTETCLARFVPQRLLDLEHDENCRTPFGLGLALGRAYPDIVPDDVVTVVTFFLDGDDDDDDDDALPGGAQGARS